MLVSAAVISASQKIVEDTGVNPGLAIRLEQSTFDAFKGAMQDFLPKYIEHDAQLPQNYDYTIGLDIPPFTEFLTYKIHWDKIRYSDARFDFKDIKLVLNNAYDMQMLKVDFPALKEWKIDAL